MNRNYIAYIDGSSMGNPGEAGFGVVLMDENRQIVETVGRYIGKATNNVAEYQGLLGCLELIEKYKPEKLTVYSDSQLLVRQINGIYRITKDHLRNLFNQIREREKILSLKLDIHYISREKNKQADQLARRAVLSRSEIT